MCSSFLSRIGSTLGRSPLAALPLVMLALAAGGCSSFSMIPPDVTLSNVEVADLTLFETSGVVTVRIANENREPLVLDGAAYQLYLDGVKVGKALTDERIEVPGLATVTQEAELIINNLVVASRLRSIFEQEAVSYRIRARLYLEGGFGRRRLSSTYEGLLDFSDRSETGSGGGAAYFVSR